LKIKVQKDGWQCDICRQNVDYPDSCLGCGKDFCHTCAEKLGGWLHTIFDGGGTRFWCGECSLRFDKPPKELMTKTEKAFDFCRRGEALWNRREQVFNQLNAERETLAEEGWTLNSMGYFQREK